MMVMSFSGSNTLSLVEGAVVEELCWLVSLIK